MTELTKVSVQKLEKLGIKTLGDLVKLTDGRNQELHIRLFEKKVKMKTIKEHVDRISALELQLKNYLHENNTLRQSLSEREDDILAYKRIIFGFLKALGV